MEPGPAKIPDRSSRGDRLEQMFERLKNWVKFRGETEDDESPAHAPALHRTGTYVRPSPPPAPTEKTTKPAARKPLKVRPGVDGEIADLGPGKNVLIRNKYRREDTGTHETLTIVDDSMIDTGEESGIDPYNTGKFDRSKNWDKRFR